MKPPLRNLLSVVAGDVGSRVIGFLITLYLARVLAPEGFGVMSIGLAVLGYLALLGSPGVQMLEARNAASVQSVDRGRVAAVLSLRLALAVVLMFLTWLTSSLVVEAGQTRNVIIGYSFCLIPLALLPDWFFHGKERFKLLGLTKIVQAASYGMIVFLLVKSAADLLVVPVGFALGQTAGVALLLGIFVKEQGWIGFRARVSEWKDILRRGIPVGTAMFLGQNASNLPPLIIGFVATTADVGMYSAAMKLIFVGLFLDRVLNALFLPVVSRYFASRQDEVGRLVAVATKSVVVFLIPAAAIGVLLAKEAVGIVYGAAYAQSAPLLQVLMGYFALTIINSVFVCTLVGSGNEKAYTRMMLAGVSITTVLVIVLTILLGLDGAAFGVVLGECATVLLMLRATIRVVRVPLVGLVARPLAAGGAMAITLFVVQDLGMVPALLLSLAAFAVSLLLLRGWGREDMRFLRERFV